MTNKSLKLNIFWKCASSLNLEFFRFIWILIFGCWFFSSSAFGAFIPDQIIIKLKSPAFILPSGTTSSPIGTVSIKSSAVKNIFDSLNVQKIKRVFENKSQQAGTINQTNDLPDLSMIYLLTLKRGSDIESAIAELKKLPEIEFAEPNYIIRALKTPNDTYFGSQWALKKISAEAAWDAEIGTNETIAAVIDTGVDYTHSDLSGSKVIKGKDFVNGDMFPMDDNGHGTHLAGIIGAITNNSNGIAGLNWNCRILAVKVLNAAGDGSAIDVANGIAYAADNSADVINMSFGDYNDVSTIRSAVAYAYSKGSVLIAAAGNENTSNLMYPAAYKDYVIAVAATDQNDVRSDWGSDPFSGEKRASNYGTWVDVSAPGSTIYSTWLHDTYANKNGTSMATPNVSGLAALILSQNPSLSQTSVKSRILSSCDNIDGQNPGFVGLLGSGRINAARALGFPTARISYPTSSIFVSGVINIAGTAVSTNIAKYELYIGTGDPATLFEKIFEGTSSVSSGTLYTYNTSYKPDGLYTIKLICQSLTPLTSETSLSFYIDNELPQVNITSPVNGSTVEGLVTIEGTATDTHFSNYTLSYSKNGIDYILIKSSTAESTNGELGTWNTTGLSGAYKLKLTATDSVSHSNSKIIDLNISGTSSQPSNISGLIKSIPNPFNPLKQSTTYLNYTLDNNYPIMIYIFSMNGELKFVKSISSGEIGGKSGENLVPWDGRDSFGDILSSGVYFFKVAAINSSSKKVIGSGRIIIIRN